MGASPEGRNVGQVLSRGEARRLSRETGKSVLDIASRASDSGVGIGAALGNQIGRAMNSPAGRDARRVGIEYNFGNSIRGESGVAPSLEGLRGLQMQRGQAYYGSTTTTTPASSTGYLDSRRDVPATTTTTPIVLPRGAAAQRMTSTTGTLTDRRQASPPPPPGIDRKDMGFYTPESLEARYTQAADRAQARSDTLTARAERTTNQRTGATKPFDLILRQRERAEDLKRKAEGYRAEATDIRTRMSSPAM